MQQTSTTVQTTTATLVGIAIMGTALLAAAAGFVIAANNALPILVIKATPQPASHAVVVGTELDPVLGFSLTSQNKPIKVDRLNFNVIGDTDGTFATVENNISAMDHIYSCGINDIQGNAVGRGSSTSTLGQIAFSDLGITIPANAGKAYRVYCTFANTPPDGSNPDIYSFSLNDDSAVTAMTGQGDAIPGARTYIGGPKDPGVNTNHAIAVTVKDSGTISARSDATSPANDIIIAGTQAKVAKFTFSSTNENYTIQHLRIRQMGDQGAAKFAYLGWYIPNNPNLMTAGVALNNGIADFSGLNIPVTAGASNALPIDITFEASAIGNGGRSGMTMSADLDMSSVGSFKAVGATSGRTMTENNFNNIMAGYGVLTLRETRPTITLSSSSPFGSSVAGRNEVIRFNVAADSRGDLAIKQLTFKMASTDNSNTGWNLCGNTTAGDFDLYDMTRDPSTTLDRADANWILMDSTGVTCASSGNVAFIRIELPTEAVITKGTSHTFALYFDSTGASSSDDDAIRFDLPAEPPFPSNPSIKSMNWADSTGVNNMIDGMYVKNLTVNGGTLVF